MDTARVIALNLPGRDQLLPGQSADDADRFLHCLPEFRGQQRSGLSSPSIELKMSDSLVFLSTEAADDPLADVAGQMQSEIPRGVLIFAATEPNLVVRQHVEAGLDAPDELSQAVYGARENQRFQGWAFHAVSLANGFR